MQGVQHMAPLLTGEVSQLQLIQHNPGQSEGQVDGS